MKEQKQKEEEQRSAVSGKKLKLKVKKSSKDKEVDTIIFFPFRKWWSIFVTMTVINYCKSKMIDCVFHIEVSET